MLDEWLSKLALPLSIILGLSLIIGTYFLIKYTTASTTISTTETNTKIVVDISGAVHNPGVYEFNNGQIIEDAIEASGGITDEADQKLLAQTINRAALLQNHGKIYIPIQGVTYSINQNLSSNISTLININTASATELDTLPGIGPVTASKIIDYRTQKILFNRIEDLMKVDGISTSKYTKLKDLITI